MKQKRFLILISLILIFTTTGCLGYLSSDSDTTYDKTINSGDNVTVVSSEITNDGNLSVKVRNNLEKSRRASLKVTYYNTNEDVIGYPNVYSTDEIPSNSTIFYNVTIDDIEKVDSYKIEAVMNN